MEILGIDIGASGIKGAPVDVERGLLAEKRCRFPTPRPSRPGAVADVVARIVKHFDWHGDIGCTFPSVVKNGIVHEVGNMHKSWTGTDGAGLFQEETGCPVTLINDADAAGLAEMEFGAGKDDDGVVIMVTLGTGIGVAVFTERVLLPNTELGHIEMNGKVAELVASDHVRKKKGLSWQKWGCRVNMYLQRMEALFSPDLFIIGGGASKKYEKFFPEIKLETPLVPARLLNDAGIVGAALVVKNNTT